MSRIAGSTGPQHATHHSSIVLARLALRAIRRLPALAVRATVLLPLRWLLLVLATVGPGRWVAILFLRIPTVSLLLVLLVRCRAPAVALLGRWRSVAVMLALLGRGGTIGLLGRGIVAALVVGRVRRWRVRLRC